MRRFLGMWGALAMLVLGNHVAHGQSRRPVSAPPGPAPCGCRTVVLVANGASDFVDVKERLDFAMEFDNTYKRAIVTRTIPWATPDSFLASRETQTAAAALMVYEIQKIQKCSPGTCIALVGFGAGARVVLLAAEHLPANTVDRIILLAPDVSCGYDVCTAARASKCGMDVFYSADDNVLPFRDGEGAFGRPRWFQVGPLPELLCAPG